MSTPDPFSDALDARASQGGSSTGDAYGDALSRRAAGLSLATPKAKSPEITDGPVGFINGAAELAGKGLVGIPYAAAHGALDLARTAHFPNTDAPGSPEPSWMDFIKPQMSENARNVAGAIGSSPVLAPVNAAIDYGKNNFPTITRVAGDVASIVPAAGAIRGIGKTIGASSDAVSAAKAAESAIEEGHPLTSSAQAERSEMEGHANAAESAGVELPPREVSPAQAYVNDSARRDLNLPKNAPITDGLLDAAKKQNVSPAYEAVKKVPEYDLGPNYQKAISKVDLSQIDEKYRPPTDGTMTGARAAELSGQLRSVARGLYDDAGNPNLTYAQREAARTQAQAHYQGAKAVEGGFRESAGATDAAQSAATGTASANATAVADNWDKARIYNAKVEAWRGSLDGAGNVSGPKIKKLLNDEPVSGPMKEVGSVVAQYPELFRSTRLQTPPAEGIIKRGARAVAPVAGAALGNFVAPGSMGAAGGAALGELAADKLLGPARR